MSRTNFFEALEARQLLSTFTVVNTADGGAGSLRQAILDANVAAGADVVQFDAALNGQTITLTSGELNIADALTISGPGAGLLAVSGNNTSTVFSVDFGVVASISGLTITDGFAIGGEGGGIRNLGTLTVTDSTVSGNDAFSGGGIFNDSGTLFVVNSTVSNNTAGNGGGIKNSTGTTTLMNSTVTANTVTGLGGGILSDGLTTLERSTVSGNSGPAGGGGIFHFLSDTLTLTDSTVSGNQTLVHGGGISSEGTLTLTNSTVSGNSADTGGGIFNDGNGALTVTNSTVSANTAITDAGGIHNFSGSLSLFNSTVAGNSAGGSGAGLNNRLGSTMTAMGSIVAGNTVGALPGDVFGTFETGSINNLIQDGASSGGLSNGVNGNLVGVDPLLDSLSDNGGQTLTHALLSGSPAINKGINPNTLATDQRGLARVRGLGIDVGAFEFSADPTLGSLAPSASSLVRGQSLILTANAAADSDGTISRVDFYRDLNGNGLLDVGEGLIGSDSSATGGYTLALATGGLPVGSVSFLAIAVDNDSGQSPASSAAVTITNAAPTLVSLTPSPSSLARGQGLTLTANGAADADGSIARVDFFRDANNNGIADSGELIGNDSNSAGGYTFAVITGTMPLGSVSFLAIAVDNDGGVSPARSAAATFTNADPTLASLSPSASSLSQGDPLTLTAAGATDSDGTVASVSFYRDANNNGIADTGELLGSDSDAAGGFTYTFTTNQSNALPTGSVKFLAVATDSDGGTSNAVQALATLVFSTRAGANGLAVGAADDADTHRVVSVNPNGHVIVFEQGWTVADLQAETGAPTATGDASIWVDPKDGLTYVAAPSDAGFILFTRASNGTWSFRNLSTETGATTSPSHGLAQFTSLGDIVVVAGITDDGKIVAFQQTLTTAAGGGPAFKFVDISGDLTSQGMTTPALNSLISYVTSWDQWTLAGIDGTGQIQAVWVNIASFTSWRTDDLSTITGAPSVQGQLAVTLTSWGGINLTGLDSGGRVLTTWWVPTFGGTWVVSDLTSAAANGTPLAAGNISGFTTPWGGLNYVGLATDGTVMAYWWEPVNNSWRVDPLLPESVPNDQRPTGALTSYSSEAGTLNVFGTNATGEVLRLWWNPGGSAVWTSEDLTDVAVRT